MGALALVLGLITAVCLPNEAAAFTRGFASKVRAMQQQAFAARFENARQFFSLGEYEKCITEARQALQHASTSEQMAATRMLLVAAYDKLGDSASAAPHKEWLKQNQK